MDLKEEGTTTTRRSVVKESSKIVSHLAPTGSIPLADVVSKKNNETDDGDEVLRVIPFLTAFNHDHIHSPEDIASSIKSCGSFLVGVMSGVMAGLLIFYKWWIFLFLFIIICILTAVSPKTTDSIVNGFLLAVYGLYVPFRNTASRIWEARKGQPPQQPTPQQPTSQ